MTLITTGNSEGITGRCDARCYLAISPVCTCCCGGKNHGVGLKQAWQNTLDYSEKIAADWNIEHANDKVVFELVQGELF